MCDGQRQINFLQVNLLEVYFGVGGAEVKKAGILLDSLPWCPGLDSNQHALYEHQPLKLACLPVSPPGQVVLRPVPRTGLEPARTCVH